MVTALAIAQLKRPAGYFVGPAADFVQWIDVKRRRAEAVRWARTVDDLRQIEANRGWVLLPPAPPKKKRGGSAHRIHKKPVRATHDPTSPFLETVDAKAVAVALNCSVQRVYALAQGGRLPHHRDEGRLYFYVNEILEHQRKQKIA
jgi:hypothetical protein